MILVDSSVWIDYLRDSPSPEVEELDALLRAGADVCLTEPIIMELLAGSPEPAVEQLVNGLPLLPIDPGQDFRAAGGLFRDSRRGGHSIRSMVDCLIAAIATRYGVPLLHRDRDFVYLAQVAPLRLHPITRS